MSEPPFLLPFIRWADVAFIDAARAMPPRRIFDHELVYVLGGYGEIIIEGRAHAATPDRLFLLAPRDWHCFRYRAAPAPAQDGRPTLSSTHTAPNLQLLGVHFDWTPQHDSMAFPIFDGPAAADDTRFRERREICHWDTRRAPFLDLSHRPRVRRALENVVLEYGRGEPESRDLAGALLAVALIEIAREARVSQSPQSTLCAPDAVRRVQRARQWLESDVPMTIEEVAARIGWSADHLRRMFRAATGQSPAQAKMSARLRRAKTLLRSEDLPIAEIARRCGFDDASHFARVFKKESGLSPRQFLALAKKL